MLRPQIDLSKYFAGPNPNVRLYDEKAYIRRQLEKYGVAAATSTLDGVTFLPKDWEDLIKTLRIAKTSDGFDAFAEGKSPEKPSHWALDLSMAATIGKGFREIWRPKLSDRPLSTRDLPGRHGFGLGRGRGQWSDDYSAQFGKDPQPQDITSLHFAVAPDRVNVHIDETGFVFEGADGALTVGPNFGHHAVNELFWKSNPHLPRWAIDHIDLILPNSANDFSRFGVSVDLYQRKNLRVTVTGSCGIFGGFECSGTLSVSGTHNLLGSKPKGAR
ncbi:hypothetical protein GPL21_27225 [Bradyrhizobium pachyrhizi]|uniref:Uncharacterized protein n=2 Tax=Nitrobacteraceae TaxID=41294 RepID=A0A844STN7_9BRAD|nr:hypothetical protein [Bradyrhizobium pachyrhizi]MVT68785.1 hypothetical protein [Bradyrhizobium pachyrhizi]